MVGCRRNLGDDEGEPNMERLSTRGWSSEWLYTIFGACRGEYVNLFKVSLSSDKSLLWLDSSCWWGTIRCLTLFSHCEEVVNSELLLTLEFCLTNGGLDNLTTAPFPCNFLFLSFSWIISVSTTAVCVLFCFSVLESAIEFRWWRFSFCDFLSCNVWWGSVCLTKISSWSLWHLLKIEIYS